VVAEVEVEDMAVVEEAEVTAAVVVVDTSVVEGEAAAADILEEAGVDSAVAA
jgi:hypothetical protein